MFCRALKARSRTKVIICSIKKDTSEAIVFEKPFAKILLEPHHMNSKICL